MFALIFLRTTLNHKFIFSTVAYDLPNMIASKFHLFPPAKIQRFNKCYQKQNIQII